MDKRMNYVIENFLDYPLITARNFSKDQNLSVDQVRSVFRHIRKKENLQERLYYWGPGEGYCIRVISNLLHNAAETVLKSIQANKPVYPSVLELHTGPTCPCDCIFCFSRNKRKACSACSPQVSTRLLTADNILSIVRTLVNKGCESIIFSGGLEPFSSKITLDVLSQLPPKPRVRIYTNGVPDILDYEAIKLAVSRASQIRFSINAATAQTYSVVQMPHRNDGNEVFAAVVNRVKKAVKIRDSLRTSGQDAAKIGVAFLTIPANYHEIEQAAILWAKVGIDFFAIGNDALTENPRLTSFNQEERLKRKSSIEKILNLRKSGRLGKMFVRPSRESVQNKLQPNAGVCYAPFFKAVIDLFGNRWACCMRAHPGLQNQAYLLDTVKSGDDFVRSVKYQELPLPFHCLECTEFEYVENICAKKLIDDLKFKIKLLDQPFKPSSKMNY
ncbi:MAG: radical SAM protein [Planctomycetes bacterium]|nr:radical SAM protein [Planctomycetota bacterium]